MSLSDRIEEWRKLQKGEALEPEDYEEIVSQEAQRLIESLYKPHPRIGWVAKEGTFASDSINWTDLRVVNVLLRDDGIYQVEIEGAATDAVYFKQWVENWLRAWGWVADVRTEDKA